MHLTSYRPRALTAALLAVAAPLLAVAAPGGALAEPAQAATRAGTTGSIRTIGPGTTGAQLTAALSALLPGDTLELAPGTYRTGLVVPNPPTMSVRTRMHVGTATAPITVRAADPARRPLILGELKLWGASHWVLDGLRVQAVDRDRDALFMGGGTGWVVRGSEFSGARQTGAYSNVSIASDVYGSGAPSGFAFTGNCVHDAASTNRGTTDHNVYVSFAGTPASGGVISRNVIFNHPRGVGIKLGNGGLAGARGPWGVRVSYNTIVNGGRQVFLHADVGNNTVSRNILSSSTQTFASLRQTTSSYFHDVIGRGNVFTSNYASGASMFSYGGNVSLRSDNAVRVDPGFVSGGCGGYRPTNPAAAAYGRYAG